MVQGMDQRAIEGAMYHGAIDWSEQWISYRRSDGSDSSRLRDGSEIMDQVIDQWAFEGAKDIIIMHTQCM